VQPALGILQFEPSNPSRVKNESKIKTFII